jgi:hypothetical protein
VEDLKFVNQLKFNKMGRKTIYSPAAIQEMKQAIRTGRPVAHLAEELSVKWGHNYLSLKNKMYGIAKSTYKIKEWKGPKRRTLCALPMFKYEKRRVSEQKQETTPPTTGARIERYEDHIRIYF